MKTSAFDSMANSYDVDFSETVSGKIQRKTVWNYLDSIFLNNQIHNVTEVGCGTGEDAIFLAKKGLEIWASDPSCSMIEVARKKAFLNGVQHKIHFSQKGFENWAHDSSDHGFQLFLANFGCLNCLPPQKIEMGFRNLNSHFPIGGRAVLVLLPPISLSEILGFLSRFKLRKAFRRWGRQPKSFFNNGLTQEVWYYSPKQILKLLGEDWVVRKKIPMVDLCTEIRSIFSFIPPLMILLFKWS